MTLCFGDSRECLGRHTLPVQSAGQYPVWHPQLATSTSLWAQHGQLTVNFLSLWTSTPPIWLPSSSLVETCSMLLSYSGLFMPFCANRLLSMETSPQTAFKLLAQQAHSDLPFIPQTQTSGVDWLVMWWRPMESLGQACSTWLPMGFWTKCLPQQQPDWSIPLQFQILVAYRPFQSQEH